MKRKKNAKHKKPQRKYAIRSIGDVDIEVGDPDEQNMVIVTVTVTNVDSPFGSGVTVTNPTDAPTAILEGSDNGTSWTLIDSREMELQPGQTNDWFKVFSPTDAKNHFRATVRRSWDATIIEEDDEEWP